MAVSLKHAFASPVADVGSANEVGSGAWNAEHTITTATDTILGRRADPGAVQDLKHSDVKTILGYPTSAADNTVPRFTGTDGNIQTSGIRISDLDDVKADSFTATGGSVAALTATITNTAKVGALTATGGDVSSATATIAGNAKVGSLTATGGAATLAGLTLNGVIGGTGVGIDDNDVLTVDAAAGAPNSAEYARFTANGLEGRTEAEFKADFNLEIGTDVQAWDAGLDDIAGLAVTDGNFIVGDGANWVAEAGATARASLDVPSSGDVEDDIEVATINAQTDTAHTLALADRGQVITMDNGSANTVTIPTNASVAFDVGTVVHVVQIGAGVTTITGGTGVTVNGVSAGSGDIQNQFQGVSLLKVATDTWIASGDIGTVA